MTDPNWQVGIPELVQSYYLPDPQDGKVLGWDGLALVNVDQLVPPTPDLTAMWCGVAGGSANAITLTPTPAITAYQAGQRFSFIGSIANTSSVTVAVSGLTTKAIVTKRGNALSGGEIQPVFVEIIYNGTSFVLISVAMFQQSGGGTVERTAEVKLRETAVAVTDFMTAAQANDVLSRIGSIDVTSAVQAALDYATGIRALYLPSGVYRVSAEITKAASNITIFGDGPDLTLFATTSTTANIFSFGDGVSTYTNVFLRNMGFTGTGGARTAGAYVKFNKVTQGGLSYFKSNIGFKTLEMLDCVLVGGSKGYITNPTASTGVGVRVRGGNDTYLQDVLVAGNSAAECRAGVFIETTSAMWMDNVGALDAGIGLLLQPQTGGDVIENLFTSRCAWDSGSSHGILVDAAAATTIRCWKSTGDWTATNDLSGITTNGAGNIQDFEFIGLRAINNSTFGVNATSGVDIRFLGGTFSGNSRGASNTYDGITFNNLTRFRVIGATSGATGVFSNTQRYGVSITGAGADNFIVEDNDLTNNTTAALSSSVATSASKIIRNNLGYVGYKEAVTTDTTDGSGDITITHGMAATPTYVRAQLQGAASIAVWQPHTIGATTFKVRFWSIPAGPGAPLTGTSVTINWEASI